MKLLKYLWQLPQNLIGLILRLIIQGERKVTNNGVTYYLKKGFPGGISLGDTIIVGREIKSTILHEHGHQIQSLYLGPLYLIVIGIPSIIWAGLRSIIKINKSYYWFYTEYWANKLVGLN